PHEVIAPGKPAPRAVRVHCVPMASVIHTPAYPGLIVAVAVVEETTAAAACARRSAWLCSPDCCCSFCPCRGRCIALTELARLVMRASHVELATIWWQIAGSCSCFCRQKTQ